MALSLMVNWKITPLQKDVWGTTVDYVRNPGNEAFAYNTSFILNSKWGMVMRCIGKYVFVRILVGLWQRKRKSDIEYFKENYDYDLVEIKIGNEVEGREEDGDEVEKGG